MIKRIGIAAISLGLAGAVLSTPAAEAGPRFGKAPLKAIMDAANNAQKCRGLGPNMLASMMIAITYNESGTGTVDNPDSYHVPAPTALSRWDPAHAHLWPKSGGTYQTWPADPLRRVYWNPGVGLFQYDDEFGSNLGAAYSIQKFTTQEDQLAANYIAAKYCRGGETMSKIFETWYGCGNNSCIRYFNEIFRPNQPPRVTAVTGFKASGGNVTHWCLWSTANSYGDGFACVLSDRNKYKPCWVDCDTPLDGNQATGEKPISYPFYDFRSKGTHPKYEYRFWPKWKDTDLSSDYFAARQYKTGSADDSSFTIRVAAKSLCDYTIATGNSSDPAGNCPTWLHNV